MPRRRCCNGLRGTETTRSVGAQPGTCRPLVVVLHYTEQRHCGTTPRVNSRRGANQYRQPAGNPQRPPTSARDLLAQARYGQDRDPEYWAASHPSTSADELERLSQSQDPVIRKSVAGNPSCPISVFERLASDPDWEVRLWTADDTRATPEILEQLVRDPVPEIVEAALINPNLPSYIKAMQQLAHDH